MTPSIQNNVAFNSCIWQCTHEIDAEVKYPIKRHTCDPVLDSVKLQAIHSSVLLDLEVADVKHKLAQDSFIQVSRPGKGSEVCAVMLLSWSHLSAPVTLHAHAQSSLLVHGTCSFPVNVLDYVHNAGDALQKGMPGWVECPG